MSLEPYNYNEFLKTTVKSILNGERLLLWGLNDLSIQLLSDIIRFNLASGICGITRGNPCSETTLHTIGDIKIFEHADIHELDFDTVVICYDKEKEDVLNLFSEPRAKFPMFILWGNANYDFCDPEYDKITASLHVQSKARGYEFMLPHLYQSLCYVVQNDIQGDVVEFGTYRGGTTVFLAEILNLLGSNRKIYSFDTFSGFPVPKSPFDFFKDPQYNHSDYETVNRYCKRFDNIILVKGEISETIGVIEQKGIAFAFFDTDNYSATKKALDVVFNNMPKGAILAFDHYYSKNHIDTLGERLAAKEILRNKKVFNLHGTGVFMKL